jgi:penicillin-binding protein 1A
VSKWFLFGLSIVGTILFSFLVGVLFYVMHYTTVDFSLLAYYDTARPTILLDDAGNEWGRFQLDKRDPIPLEQVPTHVIQAFIAAEDRHFFTHKGISWRGIARSLLVNVYHGRIVQGASTITQQLVKLLFFDARKTFKRKVQEQFYALLVEQQFTKEQILETYLNHIYFGCGIYGIQAAAHRFWGINASELTVEQSALLAGIVRSPGSYCPLLCPLSAQRRRNVVLQLMADQQYITAEQCVQAQEMPLGIVQEDSPPLAPFFKEHIRQILEKRYGKQQLYSGGFIVQTTLNTAIQQAAEKSFSAHIAQLQDSLNPCVEGALLSLDVSTGHIKALIGGSDFKKSSFNRALQARRQVGSIFKTVIYAAALEAGSTFAHQEVDEPLTIKQGTQLWQPNNFNLKFNGSMTLASALSRSNNIIAVKMFLQLGAARVIEQAKRMHIPEPLLPYPSLALGCIDLTLKEVASFFNLFANNGWYVEPCSILWIKDRWGKKIWKSQTHREPVLNSRINSQLVKVLTLSMQRFNRTRKKPLKGEFISKTGTTNDSRTCWFAGATPTLTTVVYIGCDDNRSLGKNTYPIRTAFPIWHDMYQQLHGIHGTFRYDPSLKTVTIHEKTGELCESYEKHAISILM